MRQVTKRRVVAREGVLGPIYTGISFCDKFICAVLGVPRRLFAPVFTVTHVAK